MLSSSTEEANCAMQGVTTSFMNWLYCSLVSKCEVFNNSSNGSTNKSNLPFVTNGTVEKKRKKKMLIHFCNKTNN